MATILAFRATSPARSSCPIREVRKELGMTLVQAAKAFGVSAGTIENWERDPSSGPDAGQTYDRLQAFLAEHGEDAGKNIILGCYPLRFARDLLGKSVEEMAKDVGYTRAAWLRIEGNARILPQEKLRYVESKIRSHLTELCGV